MTLLVFLIVTQLQRTMVRKSAFVAQKLSVARRYIVARSILDRLSYLFVMSNLFQLGSPPALPGKGPEGSASTVSLPIIRPEKRLSGTPCAWRSSLGTTCMFAIVTHSPAFQLLKQEVWHADNLVCQSRCIFLSGHTAAYYTNCGGRPCFGTQHDKHDERSQTEGTSQSRRSLNTTFSLRISLQCSLIHLVSFLCSQLRLQQVQRLRSLGAYKEKWKKKTRKMGTETRRRDGLRQAPKGLCALRCPEMMQLLEWHATVIMTAQFVSVAVRPTF
jgi:hypothetical protein